MKLIRRTGAVLLAAFTLLTLSGSVALAHVTVNSPGATQGGYAVLAFRVPTESDTASTTGLRVQLPTDTPFASVEVEAKPGWTFTVKKIKLATPIDTDDGPVTEAIGEIDWTATTGAITPGEFGEFRISAGPLPTKSSVTFKVIQHYSDNSDVAWVEVPAAGSTAEPEHPAPVLALEPAGTGSASTASTSASATTPTGPTVSASSGDYAKQSGLTAAFVVAAIGVAFGVGGCALGFLAWRRIRSGATVDPDSALGNG